MSSETNNFFVYKSFDEGNIAVGLLPEQYHELLSQISQEYYATLGPELLSTYAHHSWFTELPHTTQDKISVLRNSIFFNQLCGGQTCCKISVPEMDEIYYSNPPDNLQSVNLYGAISNFEVHKDLPLSFDGLKYYRVLIGLDGKNDNVITDFLKAGVKKALNKNEFAVFDFDRTTHQVVKKNNKKTVRLILKLHYIVCENCEHTEAQLSAYKWFHVYYERVTRYIMENGTNPKTFTQFALGLLAQNYMTKSMLNYLIICFFIILLFLKVHCKLDVSYENKYIIFAYIFAIFVGIFL